MAIGMELSVSAMIVFLVGSAQFAGSIPDQPSPMMLSKLTALPWVLASLIVGIWGMSTLVRKIGWQRAGRLRVGWGIVVPNLFGLTLLVFSVQWVSA